ncbi:MAG: hypothetical protein Q4C52_06825 [Eubacteriales bacterium]|nr:hypothetical protein [Eubacteriales bacterium]
MNRFFCYKRKYVKKIITGLTVLAAVVLLSPGANALAMEDGEYSVSVDMSGGSGKAAVTSPTQLRVENGTPIARIQWSSANYDYMIVDDVKYLNQSEEGMNSVFEIPVLCWDEPMNVIADTTAMGSPIEIRYQLIFYADSVGSKAELPQEAAKRVLCVALAIIVIGGILNYYVKKCSC